MAERTNTKIPTDGAPVEIVQGVPAVDVLDAVQANIFIADKDLNLVYANPRAKQTVATMSAEMQRAFRVSEGDLLGGSIHRFHRDPSRVEAILDDPAALPRRAQFTFGTVTLDTHINRISDPDGEAVGYVVAWDDVSEKVAAEQRAEALTNRLSEAVRKNQDVSASIESVATAMEQMSAAANEIARNGSQASTVVDAAATTVGSASSGMERLNEASEQISEVLTTIAQIARQTNLLALNATIEAARAGESGKGFAVVAGEVKDLSGATQGATQRIEELIANIQVLSRAAANSMNEVFDIVQTARDSQNAVAAAVEQQLTTNQAIARDLNAASQQAQSVTTDLLAFLESTTH
jgi:Methyl-accepting chemotaxis protein (MCP) signalling domain/PAS fold